MAIRVATIIGARPQFIKAAPVSRAFSKAGLVESLIHTGQHFDENMSEIFFKELGIPKPAHNLGIHGGHHGSMTGQMLEAIEGVLHQSRPDLVLVYGDTNSTLAGALAAAKMNLPVAHVEAGLRSFNRRMPEEVNRVLVDHISDLLFCPTAHSVENLRREGIIKNVFHVGDVMFDATLFARRAAMSASTVLERLGLRSGDYFLCTIHRSENTESKASMQRVIDFIDQHADGKTLVFPVHPRTRQALERYSIVPKNVMLVDPVGYFDLHRLLACAQLVLTDSGGLQKEAYFHRVPCITLRSETEWMETVEAGWNRLWTQPDYRAPRSEIDDYGAGETATVIAAKIQSYFDRQGGVEN